MASTALMPFLRPLPLPRLGSFHVFHSRTYIQPCLREEVTSKTSKTANPPPTPPGATGEPSVQLHPTITLPPLPYHVHRTASQKLPVYHLAKRGGNLHQTRVQKIEGDIERLRDEIRTALGLRPEHVVINRLTGKILVKGWYKDDIKRFLEERQF